jgi:hypothetical protein
MLLALLMHNNFFDFSLLRNFLSLRLLLYGALFKRCKQHFVMFFFESLGLFLLYSVSLRLHRLVLLLADLPCFVKGNLDLVRGVWSDKIRWLFLLEIPGCKLGSQHDLVVFVSQDHALMRLLLLFSD